MKWLLQYFKQFLLVIFFVASCIAQAVPAAASGTFYPRNDYLVDGDSLIPVPWGKETPISWVLLKGTWALRQGDVPTSYFTFNVINQNANSKILYIQQLDPKNCTVMGSGVGSLTNAKVIYATLRNTQNREVYRVNLRNFTANSFVKKVPSAYEGTVVMMSIAAINSYNFTHFSMARVSAGSLVTPACRSKLR